MIVRVDPSDLLRDEKPDTKLAQGRQATIFGMARSSSTKPARPTQAKEQAPNPVWFKPLMFGFMLLGLLWIIVYYVSGNSSPIPVLAAWNIVIGFGIMAVGFLMTTRWR
jgi:hypothetical protein